MFSKSSSSPISDLLNETKNIKETQEYLRFKTKSISKNTAVKKLASALTYHIKLVKFNNFMLIKRFEGFMYMSSDDSIVKIEPGLKDRYTHSQFEYNRNPKPIKAENYEGYNGSVTQRLPEKQDLFEQTMKEYLEARQSIEVAQKEFEIKNKTSKHSKSSVSISSRVENDRHYHNKPRVLNENRKSYVNVVDKKLEYQKRMLEMSRKSVESEVLFNPGSTSNRFLQ